MRIVAAAIQMPSDLLKLDSNLERADLLLKEAYKSGADLAALPEMFNTGYGLISDYTPMGETLDGPTLTHIRERCRAWKMTIAAGFVERCGRHLYDSLALCTPDGETHVYRKRHLVFWERFRFRPGKGSQVAKTPFGRVGLAVCADMIYRRVWNDYRNKIDVALVAAAWPDFANRHTGRPHWLMGHIGPLSAEIPAKVAADLGVPVIFANQCGSTHTTIPLVGMWLAERLPDRFAGSSTVVDGKLGTRVTAGAREELVLSEITIPSSRGPIACHSMYPLVPAATSSGSAA